MFDKLVELILAGGFVMPPLMIGCASLWYALAVRFQNLQRGSQASVNSLYKDDFKNESLFLSYAQEIKKKKAREGDVVLAHAYESFNKGSGIIATVVMISPLLGLLGTVSGMIETFDSLGDMSLFSQSGGIAGGISQALISTQMGLAVAIPGLIVGRLLARKQNSLLVDLQQLIELKNLEKEVSHA